MSTAEPKHSPPGHPYPPELTGRFQTHGEWRRRHLPAALWKPFSRHRSRLPSQSLTSHQQWSWSVACPHLGVGAAWSLLLVLLRALAERCDDLANGAPEHFGDRRFAHTTRPRPTCEQTGKPSMASGRAACRSCSRPSRSRVRLVNSVLLATSAGFSLLALLITAVRSRSVGFGGGHCLVVVLASVLRPMRKAVGVKHGDSRDGNGIRHLA